jgi:hypothetical protein
MMGTGRSSETWVSYYTQLVYPADIDLNHCCCENLKACIKFVCLMYKGISISFWAESVMKYMLTFGITC